jgi:hypothetical protein
VVQKKGPSTRDKSRLGDDAMPPEDVRRGPSSAPPLVPTVLRVDTARWPLVVLTYAGMPTKQEMAEHLREIEQNVLERRKPFAQVIDQRKGQRPDAAQRAMIAAHQNQYSFAYATYCMGEAYVANSGVRLAMQGVFWVAKLPYPHVFVDTIDEAIVWAQERLKATRKGP